MKRLFWTMAVLLVCVSSAHAEEKLSFQATAFMGSMAWFNDEVLLDIRPPVPDNSATVAYCQQQKADNGIMKVSGMAIDMGNIYREISPVTFCLNLYRAGSMMDANDMRRLILLMWSNTRFPSDLSLDPSVPPLINIYEMYWLGNLVDDNVHTPRSLSFYETVTFLSFFKSQIENLEIVKSTALDKFITEIGVGKVKAALATLRASVSNEEVNKASAAINQVKNNTMSAVINVQGERLKFVGRNNGSINQSYPKTFRLLPETVQVIKPEQGIGRKAK